MIRYYEGREKGSGEEIDLDDFKASYGKSVTVYT